MSERVELHMAHTWDCPKCGAENFARGVRAELTPAEREEMKRLMEMPPDMDGNFLTAPEEVCCSRCGETFATVLDDALDDFDPHEAFGGAPL